MILVSPLEPTPAVQEPQPQIQWPCQSPSGKEAGGSDNGKCRQREPSGTLKEKCSVLERASYQILFSFSEKHASFQSAGQAGCHFSLPANWSLANTEWQPGCPRERSRTAQHQAEEKRVSVRTERSSASLRVALGEPPPSEEKGGARQSREIQPGLCSRAGVSTQRSRQLSVCGASTLAGVECLLFPAHDRNA